MANCKKCGAEPLKGCYICGHITAPIAPTGRADSVACSELVECARYHRRQYRGTIAQIKAWQAEDLEKPHKERLMAIFKEDRDQHLRWARLLEKHSTVGGQRPLEKS